MEYAIVETTAGDRLLVVAMDRLEPLKEILGDLAVLATVTGKQTDPFRGRSITDELLQARIYLERNMSIPFGILTSLNPKSFPPDM